jgi:hypothetical protein
MKFHEVVTFAKKYSSVVLLGKLVPMSIRKTLIPVSAVLGSVSAILFLITELNVRYRFVPTKYEQPILMLAPYEKQLLLVATLSIIVFIFLYVLHAYCRYYVLASIERVFSSNDKRFRVSYEAGCVLVESESKGFVLGLLSVPESSFILNRLLVTEDIVKSLQGVVIAIDGVVPEYNQTVTLGSLWKLFYENSESFQKMLLEQKVSYDIFDTTCDWLDRLLEDEKNKATYAFG